MDTTKGRPQQLIVCAAMQMDDDHIITGVRHFSPDMRATMLKAYGEGYHLRVKEQGFIDQYGHFLDRRSAWKVAESMGQIRRIVSEPGTLYSENLY